MKTQLSGRDSKPNQIVSELGFEQGSTGAKANQIRWQELYTAKTEKAATKQTSGHEIYLLKQTNVSAVIASYQSGAINLPELFW